MSRRIRTTRQARRARLNAMRMWALKHPLRVDVAGHIAAGTISAGTISADRIESRSWHMSGTEFGLALAGASGDEVTAFLNRVDRDATVRHPVPPPLYAVVSDPAGLGDPVVDWDADS